MVFGSKVPLRFRLAEAKVIGFAGYFAALNSLAPWSENELVQDLLCFRAFGRRFLGLIRVQHVVKAGSRNPPDVFGPTLKAIYGLRCLSFACLTKFTS